MDVVLLATSSRDGLVIIWPVYNNRNIPLVSIKRKGRNKLESGNGYWPLGHWRHMAGLWAGGGGDQALA